jgi:predicted dithiol-disulfide oxidoreductase (DUF899 family)
VILARREQMGDRMANSHKIESSAEWIDARKKLLAKEKEFTHLRDQ